MASSHPEPDGKSTIVDETTALLGPVAAQDDSMSSSKAALKTTPQSNDSSVKTPDWTQILLLCYARMFEPIAFFSIFPFVNEMISRIGGVAEEDCGFYSGLIESLFSITQMMLMVPWGRAADRFGRKPVLVFSLMGMSFATALFGLSTSVWQMVVCRCFAGFFSGSVITVRTMISENSTPETQARAFSFFGFAGNVGLFLGPLIGGSLSNAAKQYPSLFGSSQFLQDFPYALPCCFIGTIGLSVVISSALFIHETLEVRKSDPENGEAPPKEWTTLELIRAPGVSIVLTIFGFVMLLAFSFTAIVPVFQFTSPELGGFGFSPLEISAFLGLAGLSQSIWTLLVFPPLQKKYGTKTVLKLCSYAWPFFFATNPLFVILLRNGMDRSTLYLILGAAMVFGSGVSMAFTAIQLLLNDVSPSHRTLGTLNALALMLLSAIRSFAPALFTSIFATGVRLHVLGGLLVWLILAALALLFTVIVNWLPPDKFIEDRDRSVQDDDL